MHNDVKIYTSEIEKKKKQPPSSKIKRMFRARPQYYYMLAWHSQSGYFVLLLNTLFNFTDYNLKQDYSENMIRWNKTRLLHNFASTDKTKFAMPHAKYPITELLPLSHSIQSRANPHFLIPSLKLPNQSPNPPVSYF